MNRKQSGNQPGEESNEVGVIVVVVAAVLAMIVMVGIVVNGWGQKPPTQTEAQP